MALTERLAIVLETVGSSAVVRDFEKVGGAASGLGGKLTGASGKLQQFGVSGQAAGGMLAGAMVSGLAAAGAAIVTFGVNAVESFSDIGQSVLAFQRASGASAEQASALVAAFDDVGIAADVGAKAIFQLGKRLSENASKLEGYGVSAARGADGNVDLAETLKNVADAYNSTADPAQRAALVAASFGKAGQQLIPILERGREGIDALYEGAAATGQILTQEQIQQAEDFRIAMDNLGDSVRSLSLAAGQYLVPALTDLVNVSTGVIDKLRSIGDIPVVGTLLKAVPEGVAMTFDMLGGSAEDAGASLGDFAGDAKEATAALVEDEKAVDALSKSLLGFTSAQRAYDASTRAVASAERNVTDARKKYNDLLKEGAVDEEKVADARRSLNDATRSLASSQRNLRERQEEYNEALTYFQAVGGDTAYDELQDASDNLADANDGVASATERQEDAARKLQQAQAGDPEFNEKLAKAKQGVADAEQSFADAQFNSVQRAYELDSALKTQNETIGENAEAVAALRSEWGQLLALKPELLSFLQGPMAALGGATAPSGGGGGLLSPAPSLGNLSPVTNNNQQVTVNVSGTAADPLTLARTIVWNLN